MEKIKFNTRSEKILVTAGCSHTQGSAFIKSNYFNPKTGRNYINTARGDFLDPRERIKKRKK